MGISKATASSVAPGAKGDLVVGSATNDAAILAVGTNDHVLTADSSTATGLKWAAPGMANPMTTTGDMIFSSSGSTPTRRAIGSTGQVLTVSGGVPTWATPSGSLTLLSTTTLSTTTTTISNISQSYRHLIVEMDKVRESTAGNRVQMRWAGITSSSYVYGFRRYDSTATDISGQSTSSIQLEPPATQNTNGTQYLTIYDYTNSSGSFKTGFLTGFFQYNATPQYGVYSGTCGYFNSSAVNSLTFFVSSGTLAGEVKIYGVN